MEYEITYHPQLIPPVYMMRSEGVHILEEWLRWAEEWRMVLSVYGKMRVDSAVLEIGCGLGRAAFPLRFILTNGTYDGFDIDKYKIDFLKNNFHRAFPNFNFKWVDLKNSFYNPNGTAEPESFQFPYPDETFDLVYAASIFTHMLPKNTCNYFVESARVLAPEGYCVFSFFLLDNYRPQQKRPSGFEMSDFNFDYYYDDFGEDFKIAFPDNPEQMTAYRLDLIKSYGSKAGLDMVGEFIPGKWSGSHTNVIGAQDLIVFKGRGNQK